MEAEELKLKVLEQRFPHKLLEQFSYKGRIFTGVITSREILGEGTANFELRADDVIISAYPKSGTTWLMMIAHLILNKGEHCDVNDQQLRGGSMQRKDWFAVLPDVPSPRLCKTHLHYQDLPAQMSSKGPRILHIMRQPKDVAVSYFHFYRSCQSLGNFSGSWQEFLEMFLEGYVMYGGWFEHVRTWWPHRKDENVLLLRYEDLIRDHRGSIEKVASFLDVDLDSNALDSIQSQTTFGSMKKNEFFQSYPPDATVRENLHARKGVIGDYKNHFTVAQDEYFNKVFAEKLGDLTDLA